MNRALLLALALAACGEPGPRVPRSEVGVPALSSSSRVSLPSSAPLDVVRFCGMEIPLDAKEIECDGESVTDLVPLARLEGLEKLSLRFTSVTDLAPLARLAKLRELEVGGCRTREERRRANCYGDEKPNPAIGYVPPPAVTPITDLSPLAGLHALEVVHLDATRITDIEPLAHLEHLRELTISSTKVARVPPMPKSLEVFVAEGVPIADIEGLRDLPKLAVVTLELCRLGSLEPLALDTSLRELRFWSQYPALTSLEPLRKLDALTVVELDNLDKVSLTPLAKKTHLRELAISNASVTDVSALSGLTSLEKLRLEAWDGSWKHGGQIDLKPIGALVGLRELTLGGNPGPLAPLSHLEALERVSLRGDTKNWVTFDLAALAHASKLVSLVIDEGEPRGLGGVGALGSLEDLSFVNAKGSPLDPLAKLGKLKSLRIDHWAPLDTTPLASLHALEHLDLTAKEIASLSPLESLGALRELALRVDKPVSVDPLAKLVGLEKLDLGPLAVADLTPLGGLVALHSFAIASPALSDLTPIAKWPLLEKLTLDGASSLHSLEPLRLAPRLREVSLAGAPVQDLDPIAHSSTLRVLFLSGTAVRREDENELLTRLGGCRSDSCAAWADLRRAYRHAYR